MSLQQPTTHFARQSKRIRWQFGVSQHTAALVAQLAYGERG